VCNDKKVGIDLKPSDLNPSSNPETIGNLIYGVGSPHDTWSPTDTDSQKTVVITLPDVNGVPAGEYPIMEIKLKSTENLGQVTVKIFDEAGKKVFEDVYDSTTMKIRPTVPGTTIVLYFSKPASPIYDLQVFACVPEETVTPPAVVTEVTIPEKVTKPEKVTGTVPATQPRTEVVTTPVIIPEGTTKPPFVCKDQKVRVDLIATDLVPSSNKDSVINLVYGLGSPSDSWKPSGDDFQKVLIINLPDINGVEAVNIPSWRLSSNQEAIVAQ
jgi:hypothetical protein